MIGESFGHGLTKRRLVFDEEEMVYGFRHLRGVSILTAPARPVKVNHPLQTRWTASDTASSSRSMRGDGTPSTGRRGLEPLGGLDVERKAISIAQACASVGVSRRTIYNWMAAGKVQYIRTAGGAVRIFEDSLWRTPDPPAPSGSNGVEASPQIR